MRGYAARRTIDDRTRGEILAYSSATSYAVSTIRSPSHDLVLADLTAPREMTARTIEVERWPR